MISSSSKQSHYNAVLALLDRFAFATREFLGCKKALELLQATEALPEGTHWSRLMYEDCGDDIFREWETALATLADDADTQLPSL
jgi:hypothetical protein